MGDGEIDPVEFGVRLLDLIETTSTKASYKYATLLAVIDEVTEIFAPGSSEKVVLSGRAVAVRALEMYWPQTEVFPTSRAGKSIVLEQSEMNDEVKKLAMFRRNHEIVPGSTIRDARRAKPREWADRERLFIHTFFKYPLIRLQAIEDRFIFDLSWNEAVGKRAIEVDGFDDSLRLKPGVANALVHLAPLLRPAIQMKWAEFVAKRNQLPQKNLSEFLFGAARDDTARIRDPLRALQNDKCFYCDRALPRDVDVDHFIPWSRHPNDLLSNFVVADMKCNRSKHASLAGLEHLQRWLARNATGGQGRAELEQISADTGWHDDPMRAMNVARSQYLVQSSKLRLWSRRDDYRPLDIDECRSLFASASGL